MSTFADVRLHHALNSAAQLAESFHPGYKISMSQYDPEITPEMKARYLSRRRTDVATLEHALAVSDFAAIRGVAHQIKGNAATFSFETLEACAIELDKAADEASTAECAKQISAIRTWLDAQA